ncbi:protein FAM83G [Latimeria chalumnae]|uniref:protein FAM83G n=1 Tax=Latimeria chalumnae TaxID=7897 RepID=UPI0003C10835|nr:PREDICTED: protein FAM83G [Latimeria chalumnae]|eukprot:XP_005997523.1 PREDICTED: protein FAM83G [Latimeria chalumnae]
MALSQVQCLDESNVNWRSSESKPEFFYSEDQRLAVESLLADGPDGFYETIKKCNIRDFLSELELQRIVQVVESYQPGSENIVRESSAPSTDGDVKERSHSLVYWPNRSDISVPELDLGWPDSVSYRGVTRANVYTQPPLEGQVHIKEVVRKMINQAQKVIGVVMDLFTDVDIFKDLLDISFKKKVPVYIILDHTNLKYFLQMCEKAKMHTGHLKNLRVRSIGGTEFYTRSATKIRGILSQKFLFVDGDKAITGSYSFTWSASRLDRNIITSLSGQAVEAFDNQFRELYLLSKEVNLNYIHLEDEPEPEPTPQVNAPQPPTSAAVAKKLINPKYALVRTNNSPDSSDKQSDKNSKQDGNKNLKGKKGKEVNQIDVKEEGPAIHPALLNMKRANMFDYLPTWVEPDPPSDLLGYINIREKDSKSTRIAIFESAESKKLRESVQQNATTVQPLNENGKVSSLPKSVKNSKEESLTEENVAPMTKHNEKDLAKPNIKESKISQEPVKDMQVPLPKPRTIYNVKSNAENSQGMESENEKKVNTTYAVKDTKVPMQSSSNQDQQVNFDNCRLRDVKENNHQTTEEKSKLVHITVSAPQKELNQTTEAVDTMDGINGEVNHNEMYIEESNEPNEPPISTMNQVDYFDASVKTPKAHSESSTPTSDEYYECENNFLKRRSLDNGFNGIFKESQPNQDELRVSRGTFESPMKNFSHSMVELREESNKLANENFERTNKALEAIRTVLQKNHSSALLKQENDQIYYKAHVKPKQSYQFASRSPASSLGSDRDGQRYYSQKPSRNPEPSRTPKVVVLKPGSYHRPSKKTSPVIGGHKYWQNKTQSSSKGTPLGITLTQFKYQSGTASPPFESVPYGKIPDSLKTPFGISFSKLAQVKHLKNKIPAHGGPLGSRKKE